jgi:N-hydroxyarylamine O-acetyltransferase
MSARSIENIDIYDAKRYSLNIETFLKKLSLGRGGYCFELNAMFMALLESIGFKCHAVAPESCGR